MTWEFGWNELYLSLIEEGKQTVTSGMWMNGSPKHNRCVMFVINNWSHVAVVFKTKRKYVKALSYSLSELKHFNPLRQRSLYVSLIKFFRPFNWTTKHNHNNIFNCPQLFLCFVYSHTITRFDSHSVAICTCISNRYSEHSFLYRFLIGIYIYFSFQNVEKKYVKSELKWKNWLFLVCIFFI